MIYLTVSTEDLATIAMSSGIGSLALAITIYLYKFASTQVEYTALTFTIAITLFAYLFFGGMIIRIRKRSGLTWWNIFGA